MLALRRVATAAAAAPLPRPRWFAALWGNGDYGRLGLGSVHSRWTPTVCPFFSDDDPPVSLSCGGAHTLFLTQSGRVFATGLNNFGQLGISPSISHIVEPVEVYGFPDKVVEISAGYYHSCAVTDDGRLFVWGNNSSGQLGLGKKAGKVISEPTVVDCLGDVVVKSAALGSEHSLVITGSGEVLSWGAGQLGHEQRHSIFGMLFKSSEFTPRLVKNLTDAKIKKISAGLLHSACIDEQGTLFVFGERVVNDTVFQSTRNASKASAILELPFSEEVACGGYHICVITKGGDLYTWGSNENGCLGLGNVNGVHSPQNVDSLSFEFPVTQISCGWKHTSAISGGNVYTWGWGGANGMFFDEELSSGGQLGHGNANDYYRPQMVNMGKNATALRISCGFNHTGGIFKCEDRQ